MQLVKHIKSMALFEVTQSKTYKTCLALDVLLSFDIEDGVSSGDLGLSVELHAGGTEQLGTVEALGRCLALLVGQHLATTTHQPIREKIVIDWHRRHLAGVAD